MTLPSWTVKLAAAAVIPVLIGMGVALSAPAPLFGETDMVVDETYRPGEFGVDLAAITGPRAPADPDAVPACADPARNASLRPCLK